MELLYDTPIVGPDEDLYHRSAMAARCARTLMGIKSEQAFVVGLTGPWGSGKTSFINMVKADLAEASVPPTVIDFNPWLYSSPEQLLAEFFEELRKAIGKNGDSRLAKALDAYAAELAAGAVAVAGMGIPQLAAFNEANPALNALEAVMFEHCIKKLSKRINKQDKPLSDLREELTQEMGRLDNNIVVIIDDLDRLPNAEICLIFKLVNLTASFPHMTYLLSYDADVVLRALREMQSSSGDSYLEKIVQLPLALPLPSRESIRSQLTTALESYMASLHTYDIDDTERARLARTFDELVLTHVDTPRRVKRYLNVFASFCEKVGEGICPTDAIGMVGVVTFLPHTARWIWKNRRELCGKVVHSYHGDSGWARVLEQSLRDVLGSDLADLADVPIAYGALKRLFPAICRWEKAGEGRAYGVNVSREEGRVANILNLELCYGALYEEGLSRIQLHRLMTNAECEELCEGIVELDAANDLERLLGLVKTSRQHLPLERKVVVAQALLGAAGRIRQDRDSSFLGITPMERAAKTLGGLLVDIGTDCADVLVEDATGLMAYSDFLGLTWFIRDERLAQLEKGRRQACLSERVYRMLAVSYTTCIADHWRDTLKTGTHPARLSWIDFDSELGTGKTAEAIALYAGDLEMRVLYSASRLSRWVSASSVKYRMGLGGEELPDPLLTGPSGKEIMAYVASEEFWSLGEEAKKCVAAYYLLTNERDELVASFGEPEVPSDVAEVLVGRWAQIESVDS